MALAGLHHPSHVTAMRTIRRVRANRYEGDGDSDSQKGIIDGTSWKHCPRRVHARAGQTLEVVLTYRLRLAAMLAHTSYDMRALVTLNNGAAFTDADHTFNAGNAFLGDVLIDLDQNFNPLWVWNAFDHLDVNRHPMNFPDWTHGNAILYSAEGMGGDSSCSEASIRPIGFMHNGAEFLGVR